MAFFNIFNRRRSLLSGGALKGLTDRHSHILFGVDDGIRTLEDSLAVLALGESAGVTDVWCTPHIMEDVPNTTEGLKLRFAELQEAYKGSIRLHLAAEYMLDTLFEERFRSGDLLMMENDTVLIETSTWNPPPELYDTLRELQKSGRRPLFAHPERYRYLTEPGYERLHKMGIHFQMNLGSIVGYYGETAMGKARWLLEKGWYSDFGTDCHRLSTLEEQINREVLTTDILSLFKA